MYRNVAATQPPESTRRLPSDWKTCELSFEPIFEALVSFKQEPDHLFVLPDHTQMEVSHVTRVSMRAFGDA